MRAALIQHSCQPDTACNLETSRRAIRAAAKQDVHLAVLQELHGHRYFCQHEDCGQFDLAEPIPGPTTEALGAWARELDMVIIGSVFERRAAGIFHNTAVVLDKGHGLAGIYRKMHIPDDPGYYEKFYFTPGEQGFEPIDTSLGRLGVLVCWDQWFPEAARLMALAGAELLLYPSAIGWDPRDTDSEQDRQRDAWCIIHRAHAIANGLPVLATNRVGYEPDPSGCSAGSRFWGTSLVCGPQGELLGQAPADEPATLIVDLDLGHSEQVRRAWPYLRDRRIDAYSELTRRYRDEVPRS